MSCIRATILVFVFFTIANAATILVSQLPQQLLFYCHSSQLLIPGQINNGTSYGSSTVFDYKCTLTPNASAPQYCRARGAAFVDSMNATQLMVSTLIFANASSSPGSGLINGVISLAGEHLITTTGNDTSSVAVVGGVRDFFAVSGQIDISTFNASNTATTVPTAAAPAPPRPPPPPPPPLGIPATPTIATTKILKFVARLVYPLYSP